MEGHVLSDLLLYRISSIGDNDNYDKIISSIIMMKMKMMMIIMMMMMIITIIINK